MLNSIKTWQEEYKKKFGLCSEKSDKCDCYKELKFISDLRKRDMEALIERLDYLDNNREEHQIIGEFKQLIKDYYEK